MIKIVYDEEKTLQEIERREQENQKATRYNRKLSILRVSLLIFCIIMIIVAACTFIYTSLHTKSISHAILVTISGALAVGSYLMFGITSDRYEELNRLDFPAARYQKIVNSEVKIVNIECNGSSVDVVCEKSDHVIHRERLGVIMDIEERTDIEEGYLDLNREVFVTPYHS